MWSWGIQHEKWQTATHIPGKFNTEADIQSRQFNDQVEWQLDKNKCICNMWGKPQIDLFASRLKTQLHVFCSWKSDPECSYLDVFTLDWGQFYSFIFPPFSLMGRYLKMILHDNADAIIIGHLWPTQP